MTELADLLKRWPSLPNEAIVHSKVVAAVTGLSERTIRYDPRLKRVYLTPNRYGFRVSNVKEILAGETTNSPGCQFGGQSVRKSDSGCVSAFADDNAHTTDDLSIPSFLDRTNDAIAGDAAAETVSGPTEEQLADAKRRASALGLTVRGRKNFVLDDGETRDPCGNYANLMFRIGWRDRRWSTDILYSAVRFRRHHIYERQRENVLSYRPTRGRRTHD